MPENPPNRPPRTDIPSPTFHERARGKLDLAWSRLEVCTNAFTELAAETQEHTRALVARTYALRKLFHLDSPDFGRPNLLGDDEVLTDSAAKIFLDEVENILTAVAAMLDRERISLPAPELPPPPPEKSPLLPPPAVIPPPPIATTNSSTGSARVAAADIAGALREQLGATNVRTADSTNSSEPTTSRILSYETIAARDATRSIGEIIAQDAASYAAKGLDGWATEVGGLSYRFLNLTSAETDYIEQKCRDGWLVIGMPSARMQLMTMPQAVNTLRPRFGSDRALANETYFAWDYIQKLIDEKNPVLTRNIPNHPYFFLFQPSERPPADSLNKTTNEQIEWVKGLHTADQHLFAIQLAEIFAAQTRLTEKGAEPMDAPTWTRLIELPRHDGGVVYVYWSSGNRGLRVSGNGGSAGSRGGVRLAGRV